MPGICNVALLGQKFMGRAHSNAYLKADKFFNLPLRPAMHTVVGLDLIGLTAFAARWGWRYYSQSWKDVIKNPEIHLIDISTPNNAHAEPALAALAAGKHVAVEKPLAGTIKDARAMRNAAVRARKSKTFVWCNYRRCPAVALMREMVREGRLGRIYHIRSTYLQSWGGPETPLSWRFQKKHAGSGAHGDLSSHLVDLTRFISGQEVLEVTGAIAETFVVDRPLAEGAKAAPRPGGKRPMGKSDVDDCVLFIARLAGGATASFEVTRIAPGRQNAIHIELNGEHGSVWFSFDDMNHLWYFDGREERRFAGWRRIMCTSAGNHPYAGAWWPDGHPIGFEHTYVNMVADIMLALAGQDPIEPLPDFADAYETQRVLEAALLAAKHRAAVKINEIK